MISPSTLPGIFLLHPRPKNLRIRCRLLTTDNEKYVKRGQALIIVDDPQRREGVVVINRNKAGVPFQYTGSPFAALW